MTIKTTLVLINLGTPKSLQLKDIKAYLKEFLMDAQVIDLPYVLRTLLVKGIIVPFRSPKTKEAYEAIWDREKGSPLMFHTLKLANDLKAQFDGDETLGIDQVKVAMRYGEPSLERVFKEIDIEQKGNKNCRTLVLPLYPQYAASTVGTTLRKIYQLCQAQWNTPALNVIPPFYEHPLYTQALALNIKNHLQDKNYDHLLFSFHGLPVRHLVKSGCQKDLPCLRSPCPEKVENGNFCYRYQSYQISRKVFKALDLPPQKTSVSFQSRLGKDEWLKPFTDEIVKDIYRGGARKLAVACPSFVSDCLETLEEIGIQLKEQWLSLGGEEFHLIPCLNDDPHWVQALGQLVSSHTEN